jgi:hypothetical protein
LVSYRLAIGLQQGRKVFTLQILPAREEDDRFVQVAKVSGFSLYVGDAAEAWEWQKLERICRCISRPAVFEKPLSLAHSGNIRYQLKAPYRDSTTHVIFEPLDFIAKLAALVPKPRGNLTRFHGVFAPNSKHRCHVTSARRGKGKPVIIGEQNTRTVSLGRDLGKAPEACVQYRRFGLPEVRRRSQGDSQYRGSDGHRYDFAALAGQG